MSVQLHWADAVAGDLVTFVRGVSYKKEQAREAPKAGYVPILRAGNLQGGSIQWLDLVYVPAACVSDDQRLREGDIVVAMSSGSASVVGKAATVTKEDAARGASFGAFCGLWRPVEPTLSRWVAAFFQTTEYRSAVSAASLGVNINNLRASHIATLPVQLPPAPEQKRIVAKIEELKARSRMANQALDAVPPLLDELRQSILASAFRGDLTADWRTKNPNVERAEDLLARMLRDHAERSGGRNRASASSEWSPSAEVAELMQPFLERLPALGWRVAPLETLCDPSRPITYGIVQTGEPVDGGIPTVRCGDVRENGILLTGLKQVSPVIESQYPRTRLRGGEVLVAIRGTVGGVAVAGSELAGANISREVAMLATLPGLNPEFLALALASPYGAALLSLHTKGVAQSGVNIADLRCFPVLLPPVVEQEAIVARVEVAFAKLRVASDLMDSSLNALDQLDQAILAKAFRGELVPHDPNDEPASVFLERLRSQAASVSSQPRSRRRVESGGDRDDDQKENDREHGHRTRTVKIASATVEALDDSHAPGAPLHDDWLQPARRRQADETFGPPAVLETLDEDDVHHAVFAALWPLGPRDKDSAVRRVAEYLRDAGNITYRRLRSDGDMYASVLACVEGAVKAGYLDRPKRGQVRACKTDATEYTADDWRTALVNSLGTEPVDRDEAIRAAAEWAREYMGLEFARLRSDGHIVEGLRSAINSGIRRGAIIRHDAKRISRAEEGDSHESELADSDDDESIPTEPEVADANPEEELDRKPTIERSEEPLVLDGSETVLVLQMGELDAYRALCLVVPAIDGALRLEGIPKEDAHWRFFLGFDQFHVEGLSTWLGLSKSVPSRVVDLIQKLIEVSGQRVRREYAPVATHHLEPFLVATSSGVETPIRGALVLDRGQLEELHVPRVTRRPFVVDTKRARASQQLLNLFLGPDPVE